MPRPCGQLAVALASRFVSLEKTRARVEALTSSGDLGVPAAEQVYEGLFLNTMTGFEAFIENLFIGLLVEGAHGLKSGHNVQARVLVRSHAVARQVVLSPRQNYVDWMPYERTLEQAERLFRGGRPFSLLSKSQIETLLRAMRIRNAIAHRSRHSLSVFERLVIGSTPVGLRESTPAGYLRGLLMASPPRTRFEDYAASLAAIARLLAR